MQFKVPQNIDMQDKIIGPFTMMQFLYLMIGGVIDYILLQTVFPTKPILFFLIAGPIGLLALLMAIGKWNDQPFPKFIQAFLLFLSHPKARMWHKVPYKNPIREAPVKKSDGKLVVKRGIQKSQIEKMASVLDTAGWAAVRDQKLKDFLSDDKKSEVKGQKPKAEKTKHIS